jgi:hypothetical protein
MTTSLKVLTALGLLVLAAPALAHGGGVHGMHDQLSHMTTTGQTTTKTTSTHDRSRTELTKLNMLNVRQHALLVKVGGNVVGLLAAYTKDLASGNAAAAQAVAKEIRALSVDLARNGLSTVVANGGFRVTIGKGVGSKVVFTPIVI